ncbi:hypothetical protein ADK66_22355 [Micromonospora sp. NRRL B-16802]|uniref:tetratricopeptide repeat protein n=1 Tax=Micromonospora sp. NRRL B-16802 TaxID=1415541 RepID=UPI0006AE99F6|nr:hypothetical protein [Micromonospora sp. NRRL B-16802]KOX06665.1 hypothetical protein ADK66_22355 [Micromonospora sp. NRRL B-16802]
MAYDLSRLDERRFEELCRALAVHVLGPAIQAFGAGPDGGREATFDGRVSYRADWNGYGVLQAKCRQIADGVPDAQWLRRTLTSELNQWLEPRRRRVTDGRMPQYLIVATNVRLSSVAGRGGIDRVNDLLSEYAQRLGLKGWALWDANQLSAYLDAFPDISRRFAEFLTPGDVLAQAMDTINDVNEALRVRRRSSVAPERPVVDWEPFDLGVHRSISPAERVATILPDYVGRSHDAKLHRLLHPLPTNGVLIVLVGGSSTGKTRTAYEAVLTCLPDQALEFPTTALALSERRPAGPPSVIWLDEAQRYFNSPHGEAAAVAVMEMLRSNAPVVVIGTLWPQYWQRFTTQPEPGDADPHHEARTLLARAVRIDVPPTFLPVDVDLARSRSDPRLRDAIATAGSSNRITQALAAGPDLIAAYQDADPYAQALMLAAADARAAGRAAPLSAAMLEHAAAGYLDEQQRARTAPWFAAAIAYVTRMVKGVIAPLTPVRSQPDLGEPDGYVLADYLLQHLRPEQDMYPLPPQLWAVLLADPGPLEDQLRLAREAEERHLYRDVVTLCASPANQGSPGAAMAIGVLLSRLDRHDESDPWVRRAAELGHEGAIQSLAQRYVWDATSGQAVHEDPTDAERHLRQLVENPNDLDALVRLVYLLTDSARSDEARALLTERAEQGNPPALVVLANLLYEQDQQGDLEPLLHEQTAKGSPIAAILLAGLMNELGRAEESQTLRSTIVHKIPADALEHCVELLIEGDQWCGADGLLRHAAENGHAWAMQRLAGLLIEDGIEFDDDPELFEEGESLLRRAADAGDRYANVLLPSMLNRLGKTEDAADVLQQRAATDDQEILLDVASQLMHLGHHDEANEVLRRLTAAGKPQAPVRVAYLLRQAGQPEQAEALLRQTAAEDLHVLVELARMLAETRRTAEAEQLLRGVAQPTTEVLSTLADVLEKDGRAKEAERALRDACLAGADLIDLQLSLKGIEAEQLRRYGLEPDGRNAAPWRAPEPTPEVGTAVNEYPPFAEWFGLPYPRYPYREP